MAKAKTLNKAELKRVLNYNDAHERYSERNRAMILLTHLCGMRIGEVVKLKVSDVIDENRWLFCVLKRKPPLKRTTACLKYRSNSFRIRFDTNTVRACWPLVCFLVSCISALISSFPSITSETFNLTTSPILIPHKCVNSIIALLRSL